MNALAIDCAGTRLVVSAKYGALVKNANFVPSIHDNKSEKKIALVCDVGMKQSETLLPAIDEIMKKLALSPSELDYSALCAGPGSFTGLRLAFAALKAIKMAHGVPIYAIPTLECYAFPYRALPCPALSVIDAKKNKFYAAVFSDSKEIVKAGDYTIEEIFSAIEASAEIVALERGIVCCGPDAKLFAERAAKLESDGAVTQNASEREKINNFCPRPQINNSRPRSASKLLINNIFVQDFCDVTTDALFALAEEKIARGEEPLKDYDGPRYLRASEAEEHLVK